MYFGRDGRAISQEQWIAIFEDDMGRRVDLTDLPGEVRVSTVFLGLNHQYGDGPPLIFETMIFGGPLDDWTDRYSTEEEAKAGHTHAVKLAEAANAARFVGSDG